MIILGIKEKYNIILRANYEYRNENSNIMFAKHISYTNL